MRQVLSFLAAVSASILLWACLSEHSGPTGSDSAYFTTSVKGLEEARPPAVLDLKDGDSLVLTAAPVKKVLRGMEVRMLAYNGSIPGPLIRVPQGARITVRLRNRLGLPTTLHTHGVRLENAFDGSTDVQTPIADRDSFDYTLSFPDPGPFWYHPHFRESYTQESGLYGGILVAPRDSGYWAPADREVPIILDDVLMDSAGMMKFRTDMTDHTMMGRFGNVFLANGDTALTLAVHRKELVRFYFTNACNARVLNLGFHTKDASGDFQSRSMRMAGTDMGRYLTQFFPNYQIVAPGERIVSEMVFDDTGTVYLNHTIAKVDTPKSYITLAVIKVLPDSVTTGFGGDFFRFDTNGFARASIDSFRTDFDRPPDKNLLLTVRMNHGALMKSAHGSDGKGIEWQDHPVMGMDNAASNLTNTTWVIRDTQDGSENQNINWSFSRGQRVMIRIYNDATSMHPMPHPIHFHGQRFLVINVNGMRDPEISWKDTYLVGRGETVDLLLDASNPGKWMAHCHISEHLEDMMMFNYRVE